MRSRRFHKVFDQWIDGKRNGYTGGVRYTGAMLRGGVEVDTALRAFAQQQVLRVVIPIDDATWQSNPRGGKGVPSAPLGGLVAEGLRLNAGQTTLGLCPRLVDDAGNAFELGRLHVRLDGKARLTLASPDGVTAATAVGVPTGLTGQRAVIHDRSVPLVPTDAQVVGQGLVNDARSLRGTLVINRDSDVNPAVMLQDVCAEGPTAEQAATICSNAMQTY